MNTEYTQGLKKRNMKRLEYPPLVLLIVGLHLSRKTVRHNRPIRRAGFMSCEAPSNCDSTWGPNRLLPKHYINNIKIWLNAFRVIVILQPFKFCFKNMWAPWVRGTQALLLLLLCKSGTAHTVKTVFPETRSSVWNAWPVTWFLSLIIIHADRSL